MAAAMRRAARCVLHHTLLNGSFVNIRECVEAPRCLQYLVFAHGSRAGATV